MTAIVVDLAAPSEAGTETPNGALDFKPTARHLVDKTIVLPAAFSVPVTAMPLTIDLAPTDDTRWCWKVTERITGGTTRHVRVPDSPSPLDYADLVDVDPKSLDPSVDPEPAWWGTIADQQAAITDLAAQVEAVATPPIIPDPDHTLFFLIPSGTNTVTPDPAHSGFFKIGA